jgi:hypothetical protein
MKPRVPGSKTMRVATALTGMTACAAGFLPTAAAQAATTAGRPGNLAKVQTGEGKLVRLKVFQGGITPDGRTIRPGITADPREPYWLNIYFQSSVTKFQVCGYHPGNAYRCTGTISVGDVARSYSYSDVGGNKHSWDLGQITVGWDGGGPGRNDTCNTNGAWHGYWTPGISGYEVATLTAASGYPIGNGVPEC